ncbi:MAG: hypothetical protein IJB86_07480 [Clostridia bacterium]|nr:hypothetical protein [Clostridia bacterium]
MIDIHSHILYGIDDGPDDVYESVRLCEMGNEYGIDRAVATPHITLSDSIGDFVAVRDRRIARLSEILKQKDIELQLYPGAELFVDDEIYYTKKLDSLTINGSRYLLVEFDFHNLSPRRLISYIDEVFRMGYVPIVAHPERYSYMQRDYALADFLSERGALFQINADSLAGLSGYEEFHLAYRMVRHNCASFIATDAHSHLQRKNDMLRLIGSFPPDISRESLDFMLYEAPSRVLRDSDLPRIHRRRIAIR